MPIKTLSELFLVVAGHQKADCLLYKSGGRFEPISSAELVDRVRRLATALIELGVERGDTVALMAENGPHWPVADFATLCIGGVVVPVYPTLTPDQAAYVVNDCDAKLVLVQGRERLDGLLGERGDMPSVERFVAIDVEPAGDEALSYSRLLAESAAMPADELERQARLAKPDDLATFIYTSGTTGNPKGVMLSHGNITSNVLASLECLDIEGSYTALSFLPLSHSFERTIDYIYFYRGTTIAYAESVSAVAKNLREVNPHVFVSVPRVYEKIIAKVHEGVASSPPLKQKIFRWAEGVARQALPYRLQRQRPPGLLGLKTALADKLVFGKLKEALGDRFRFAMSGGAPLAPEIARFFWGAGIEIYEGYGLSETSPVLTVNRPGRTKLGTVGPALPGVELQDRRGRRDPRPWSQHHARLPQPARGDRRDDRRRGLVPHRRHRRDRRRRLPQDHRPQERDHRQRLRQERRPGADRERAQVQPVHRPGGGHRRPAQDAGGAAGARLRHPGQLGPRARGWPPTTSRRCSPSRGCSSCSSTRWRRSTTSSPATSRSRSGSCCPTSSPSRPAS